MISVLEGQRDRDQSQADGCFARAGVGLASEFTAAQTRVPGTGGTGVLAPQREAESAPPPHLPSQVSPNLMGPRIRHAHRGCAPSTYVYPSVRDSGASVTAPTGATRHGNN